MNERIKRRLHENGWVATAHIDDDHLAIYYFGAAREIAHYTLLPHILYIRICVYLCILTEFIALDSAAFFFRMLKSSARGTDIWADKNPLLCSKRKFFFASFDVANNKFHLFCCLYFYSAPFKNVYYYHCWFCTANRKKLQINRKKHIVDKLFTGFFPIRRRRRRRGRTLTKEEKWWLRHDEKSHAHRIENKCCTNVT